MARWRHLLSHIELLLGWAQCSGCGGIYRLYDWQRQDGHCRNGGLYCMYCLSTSACGCNSC